MKVLKIFGIVIGIHLFALILIFANPGCSSTSKPMPAPIDTVAKTEPPASVRLPFSEPKNASSPVSAAPVTFNPDAPATDSTTSGGVRFVPTRPGSPAASTLQTIPVTDVTPATTYTVKAGDTLWDLGKKFHISYAQIAAANNLKTNVALHVGQKLIMPGKSVSAAPAAAATGNVTNGTTGAAKPAESLRSAPVAGNGVKHVVKPGETLGTIARIYGVKQGEIAVANNISDPQKIRAGVELSIPGWQPAGAAAKGAGKSGAKAADPAAKDPESKLIFNILDAAASAPASNPGDVPVIKVEDNPMTPAPKSN